MQYSLKELRARYGWTQTYVAQKMGIAVQTYCAWEKSLTHVKVGKVLELAELFGVEFKDIKIQ